VKITVREYYRRRREAAEAALRHSADEAAERAPVVQQRGTATAAKRSPAAKSKGKRAPPQKKKVAAARKFSSSSSSSSRSSYSGSSTVNVKRCSNVVEDLNLYIWIPIFLYPFWEVLSYKWICIPYKCCLHLIFGFISHFSSTKLSSLPTPLLLYDLYRYWL
jgi:hypothetical protein